MKEIVLLSILRLAGMLFILFSFFLSLPEEDLPKIENTCSNYGGLKKADLPEIFDDHIKVLCNNGETFELKKSSYLVQSRSSLWTVPESESSEK